MKTTVTVVPPGEPRIELAVTGMKNFQAQADGFVAQVTVADLKDLWTAITTKLVEAGGGAS